MPEYIVKAQGEQPIKIHSDKEIKEGDYVSAPRTGTDGFFAYEKRKVVRIAREPEPTAPHEKMPAQLQAENNWRDPITLHVE